VSPEPRLCLCKVISPIRTHPNSTQIPRIGRSWVEMLLLAQWATQKGSKMQGCYLSVESNHRRQYWLICCAQQRVKVNFEGVVVYIDAFSRLWIARWSLKSIGMSMDPTIIMSQLRRHLDDVANLRCTKLLMSTWRYTTRKQRTQPEAANTSTVGERKSGRSTRESTFW